MSMSSHQADLTSVRQASAKALVNLSGGSLAMTVQTRTSHRMASMIRSLIRSQTGRCFLVSRSSSLGRPPGGGSPSGALSGPEVSGGAIVIRSS